MTGRLYVKLDPEAFAAIVARARAERRHPSDQAAVMLQKVLQDPKRRDKTAPRPSGAGK